MKCNLETNSNMSFGRILSMRNGKEFLERNLNESGKDELRKLIESQKNNPVDVVVSDIGNDYLIGFTSLIKTNGDIRTKNYVQRKSFETPLDFIKRLCKKADKLHKRHDGNIHKVNNNKYELNI